MSFTQSRLELVYERDGRVGERVFSGPQSRATGVRLRAGFLLYLGFALTLTPTTLTRRISRQIRLSTFFIHPRWRYTPRLGLVFY